MLRVHVAHTPVGKFFAGATSLPRAGLDPQKGIGREKSDDAGKQRHNADPAPGNLRTNKHEYNQDQSDDDPQEAVETSFVPWRDEQSFFVVDDIRIAPHS